MAQEKLIPVILSAVPIGLGHLRAAWPLEQKTKGKIIVASRLGTDSEQTLWKHLKMPYDFLSWFTHKPFLSGFALRLLDKAQGIPPLDSKKNLIHSTPQVKTLFMMIKMGLARKIVAMAKKHPDMPFVTTFYATALAADYAGLEKIICIVCDTQVNRAWVSLLPLMSRINYCVPVIQTKKRLMAYGVPEKHIHITGFPLPEENVKFAREDLEKRIKKFKENKGINIMFSVSGAGTQLDLALKTYYKLEEKIKAGQVNLTISCGMRQIVRDYFRKKLGDKPVFLFFGKNSQEYFPGFNKLLRTTDLLITKPSELCFYSALGIPLLLTPAIGPHEQYNQKWLESLDASIPCDQALDDFDRLLSNGTFARIARNGFDKVSKDGTENIYKLINSV